MTESQQRMEEASSGIDLFLRTTADGNFLVSASVFRQLSSLITKAQDVRRKANPDPNVSARTSAEQYRKRLASLHTRLQEIKSHLLREREQLDTERALVASTLAWHRSFSNTR